MITYGLTPKPLDSVAVAVAVRRPPPLAKPAQLCFIARMPAPPPTGQDLVSVAVRVANLDVVWLRSVVEAYDGLAQVYGDGTGRILLITPASRAAELNELVSALETEIRLQRL